MTMLSEQRIDQILCLQMMGRERTPEELCPLLARAVDDLLAEREEKAQRIAELEKVIRRLLDEAAPEYPQEDFIIYAGHVCGDPSSSCDGNCVDNARMAEHNAVLRMARAALRSGVKA